MKIGDGKKRGRRQLEPDSWNFFREKEKEQRGRKKGKEQRGRLFGEKEKNCLRHGFYSCDVLVLHRMMHQFVFNKKGEASEIELC